MGIRIRQKPPKPFKNGEEWVNSRTLWEMPVFQGSSRSKKRSFSEISGVLRAHEKTAKEWAGKAWQSLDCREPEPVPVGASGVYTLALPFSGATEL